MIFIIPILIVLLIVIQSFFTSTEMAAVSSNKIKLKYLANHNKRAKIINSLLEKPERLFSITLISINLITVLLTILTEYYFEVIIKNKINFFIPPEIITILIIEPLILICGELTPMTLGRKYSTNLSLKNSYLLKAAYLILFPLITPLLAVLTFFQKISGKSKKHSFTREELEIIFTTAFFHRKKEFNVIDYAKEVLQISKLTANDVMTHIQNIVAVDEKTTIKEFKEIIKKNKNNRIPVYRDNILNIIGTVHILNILGVDDNEKVGDYCDKLYIIPTTKPILQVLRELKNNRKYVGIVVDDYGAACGFISLQDIIGRIISEIKKDEKQQILNRNELLEFDGLMKLEDFYKETGIDLRGKNITTLNGFINSLLGRIAKKGEIIEYKNYKFKVLDATDRIVKRVQLIISK